MFRHFLLVSTVITLIFPSLAYSMERQDEEEKIPESGITYPSMSRRESVETQDLESSSQEMKFKLGFEFQEISGLCRWALNDNNIQRKPLFCFEYKADARRLWKVVIDTSDIEFVTEPFTHNERLQVERAIHTLGQGFRALQGLLTSQGSVTFEEWIDKMEEQGVGGLGNPFRFKFFGTYDLIRHGSITQPSAKWKPTFAPQVTIQHSLTRTIPLCFSLFGFHNPYMFQFSSSLPLRDLFLEAFSKAQKEGNSDIMKDVMRGYQQKINGLVFLHALTLVQMTNEADPDDKDLVEETHTGFTDYSQFDAKMKFLIMSRRPFSSMFKDIGTEGSYEDYFKTVMGHNSRFTDIPSLFYKTNYAEQFFDPNTELPKSLLHLLPLIRKEFREQNQERLTELLSQGIVSTTMIRNFREDVKVDGSFSVSDLFNRFYERAIKTVDSPDRTYIFNEDTDTIHSVQFQHDVLSPPYFLNFDNSMGSFKMDLTEEESQYGEAIIEVRGIKDVKPWFLKKCNLLQERSGYFMTEPGPKLKTQALCLFDFVRDFGSFQDDTIEIFYLGLPHALKEH